MLEALETLCLLIGFYDRTPMFLSSQEFENSRNLVKVLQGLCLAEQVGLGKRQKTVSYCDEVSYHAPPYKKWEVH